VLKGWKIKSEGLLVKCWIRVLRFELISSYLVFNSVWSCSMLSSWVFMPVWLKTRLSSLASRAFCLSLCLASSSFNTTRAGSSKSSLLMKNSSGFKENFLEREGSDKYSRRLSIRGWLWGSSFQKMFFHKSTMSIVFLTLANQYERFTLTFPEDRCFMLHSFILSHSELIPLGSLALCVDKYQTFREYLRTML